MSRRLSRGVLLVPEAAEFSALVVAAPLSLSQLGRRHGWSGGRPGRRNLAGVLPLGVGAAVLVWAMSSHYRAAPRGWEAGLTPHYLLVRGPYRYSRNPMYVGESAMWTGWAMLFGSLPVTAGLAGLAVLQNGLVRFEERMLRRRWGDSYDVYRARVPRWLVSRG